MGKKQRKIQRQTKGNKASTESCGYIYNVNSNQKKTNNRKNDDKSEYLWVSSLAETPYPSTANAGCWWRVGIAGVRAGVRARLVEAVAINEIIVAG